MNKEALIEWSQRIPSFVFMCFYFVKKDQPVKYSREMTVEYLLRHSWQLTPPANMKLKLRKAFPTNAEAWVCFQGRREDFDMHSSPVITISQPAYYCPVTSKMLGWAR